MQLTTREAVEIAIKCICKEIAHGEAFDENMKKERGAVRMLCDHYGFKLSQFFDVEEA